jgi:hypothetical protein
MEWPGPTTLSAVRAQAAPSIIADIIARRSVAYALATLVSRDVLGWFRRLAKVHQLALRTAQSIKLLYTSPS